MDLFAPTHIILLLLVILIIFGPSKLGDVGGALGKGIRDFKRAINEPESLPPVGGLVALPPPHGRGWAGYAQARAAMFRHGR
jgi:TatA/E family protein of Tat protein translocase